MGKPVYVTEPFLPPLEELQVYLKDIWESRSLTNNGKYHQELEKALCDYLGVEYISLFSNGTLALVTALQTLRITGEVITTPYSFVATTHSLWWNGIKPVFVDIEPDSFNIDPEKIEYAKSDFLARLDRTGQNQFSVKEKELIIKTGFTLLDSIYSCGIIEMIPEEVSNKYTVVRSAPFYLEFLNKAVNKGAGVAALAEKLNIKQEEVICIGDAGNDIHMIEYAGLGVAMGNAFPEVKKVANFITKTNEQDGVAHIINKFILHVEEEFAV